MEWQLPHGFCWYNLVAWNFACIKPNQTKGKMQMSRISSVDLGHMNQTTGPKRYKKSTCCTCCSAQLNWKYLGPYEICFIFLQIPFFSPPNSGCRFFAPPPNFNLLEFRNTLFFLVFHMVFASIYTFPIDSMLTELAKQCITWCMEVIWELLGSVFWDKWQVS